MQKFNMFMSGVNVMGALWSLSLGSYTLAAINVGVAVLCALTAQLPTR